jgi:DNA-binding response OmpR family regulator
LLSFEDDPDVAKIVSLIAHSSGMECRSVSNAAEFFRVADEWNPTHIALDMIIPETDVARVLVEMARRRCSARIIITSGMGERMLESARLTGLGHGLNMAGVLAKPFSMGEMRDLLRGSASLPSACGQTGVPRSPGLRVRVARSAVAERERSQDQHERHPLPAEDGILRSWMES